METIKQYYRLCSIKAKDDKPLALYNQIDEKVLESIFTKKHVELFLKKDANIYKIRETVIGAKQRKQTKNTLPALIY